MSLDADNMILCIENPKDSTLKLLDLIKELKKKKKKEFSKTAGYINVQKLVAFLYTNNKISER